MSATCDEKGGRAGFVQNNRNVTSTMTRTGTGVPSRVAGWNCQVWTVRIACSDNPKERGLTTVTSPTSPCAFTTSMSTTVPEYLAIRASPNREVQA